ncbi:hypothetical protein, partial [Daejeonella sp.]|uniref:hypothetical protein n=1 Tax=Daejeonella sp. TaxID=2805397 RepID=UPI0039839BEA
MKYFYIIIFTLTVITALYSCNQNTESSENNDPLMQQSWEQITQKAKGTSVVWMKYLGDKKANKHIEEVIVPLIKEKYDITLIIIPGQGNGIVSSIMSEKEAGLEKGETDIVWINGETFYQL